MYNKHSKTAIILLILFDVILIINTIISLISNNSKSLWLSILNIIVLYFPFLITNLCNKKENTSSKNFETITALFIFCAFFLGEINNFYIKYKWLDLLLHTVFGIYMVIVSLNLIKGIIKKEQNISQKRFKMFSIIFALSLTTMLGTLWELFEFIVDYFINYGMVKGGLEDTCTDLMVKFAASLITSVIIYFNKTSLENN